MGFDPGDTVGSFVCEELGANVGEIVGDGVTGLPVGEFDGMSVLQYSLEDRPTINSSLPHVSPRKCWAMTVSTSSNSSIDA